MDPERLLVGLPRWNKLQIIVYLSVFFVFFRASLNSYGFGFVADPPEFVCQMENAVSFAQLPVQH